MKKLSKSMKLVLVSVVSFVCILGIVLGCVLLIKPDKKNTNPSVPLVPNNPAPPPEEVVEKTITWGEKMTLLGQDVNAILSLENEFFEIDGEPYASYVTEEMSLYDLGKNYFVLRNSSGSEDVYYFSYSAGTLTTQKLNSPKTDGGFGSEDCLEPIILAYNSNYVIIESIVSGEENGKIEVSFVDIRGEKPILAGSYLIECAPNERKTIDERGISSDGEYYFFMIYEEIYDEEGQLTKSEEILNMTNLSTGKTYELDKFNSEESAGYIICSAGNGLLLYSESDCRAYILSGDKVISGNVKLPQGDVYSTAIAVSEYQFVVESYFESTEKSQASVYINETTYANYHYTAVTIAADGKSLTSTKIDMSEDVSKLDIKQVSENFYSIKELKTTEDNFIDDTNSISYYYKDGSLVLKFETKDYSEKILRISQSSVLTNKRLIHYSEANKTDELLKFGTSCYMFIDKSSSDEFVVVRQNGDDFKIQIVDMKGKTLKENETLKVLNFDNEEISYSSIIGVASDGKSYYVYSNTSLYKLNYDTLNLEEFAATYKGSNAIYQLQNSRNFNILLTANADGSFDVIDFDGNKIVSSARDYSFVETIEKGAMIVFNTTDGEKIIRFNGDFQYRAFVESIPSEVQSYSMNNLNPDNEVTPYGWFSSHDELVSGYTGYVYLYDYSSYTTQRSDLRHYWYETIFGIHSSDYYYYSFSISGTTTSPGYRWSFSGWGSGTSVTFSGNSSSYSPQFSSASSHSYYYYAVYTRSWTNEYISGTSRSSTTVSQTSSYRGGTRTNVSLTSGSATYWSFYGFTNEGSGSFTRSYSSTSICPAFTSYGNQYITAIYYRNITLNYYSTYKTGGSTGSQTKTVYASAFTSYGSTTLANNGFQRNGYTFSQWALGSDSGSRYYQGGSFTPYSRFETSTSTFSFYAVWSANWYTIYFNKNGGTGGTNSITFTYGTDITTYVSVPTRTGYIFEGYYAPTNPLQYDCNADEIYVRSDGWVWTDTDNDIYGDITLIAHWKAITYYIQLSSNSGNFSGATVGSGSAGLSYYSTNKFLATYDSVGVISVQVQRTGYTFSGWTASNYISSTGYTCSPTYTTKNDTTLYITVTTKVKNLTTTQGATVTLTANWTAITYTLKFDTNRPSLASHTPSVSPTSTTVTYDRSYTMPKPTLTGWTCQGWAKSSTASASYSCNSSYILNLTTTKGATVTLYATWTQNHYTIIFNTNKPSSASHQPNAVNPASIHATYEVYYEMPTPTLTGWTCSGWATSSSGSAIYSCGSTYRNFNSTANGTTTLYAKWVANNYYIVYQKNQPKDASGTVSGTVSDTLCTYDSSVKLSSTKFSLTGWTQIGWDLDPSVKTPTYSVGQTISPHPNFTDTKNGSVFMYAIWRVNTYYIELDPNGGTISGVSALTGLSYNGTKFTATYDKEGKFANYIVRPGYMFNGWTISTGKGRANAVPVNESYASFTAYYNTYPETTYEIGATTTVLNLTPTDGATVKLTASWTGITYYVTLSTAISSGANKPVLTYPSDTAVENISFANSRYSIQYGKTGKFKIKTNRNGYEFNGWSKSTSIGTVTPQYTTIDDTTTTIDVTTSILNLTTKSKDTVTLTELWTPIQYKIKLSGAGGKIQPQGSPSGLTASTSSDYDYIATFDTTGSFNALSSRKGYKFSGFDISTKLGAATAKPTSYASFDVYYNTYKDTSVDIIVLATVLNISHVRGETVILSVDWTAITYKLVYQSAKPTKDIYGVDSSETPTGSTAPSIATYGEPSVLSPNGFTLIGWNFIGWSTKKSNTAEYSANQATSQPLNLTGVIDAEVPIYAVWAQNVYNIVHKFNNGTYKSDGVYPKTAQYDSWFMISTPVRVGYTFKNYTIYTFTTNNIKYHGESENSANRIDKSQTTYTNSKNMDYYYKNLCSTNGGSITFEAMWTPNTYRIEYDYNQGKAASSGIYPTLATYDVAFTVSAPERLGYTFTGWNITKMDTACEHFYGNSSTSASAIESTLATQFKNLRANDDNIIVHFKALWRANQYKIKYELSGGTQSSSGSYPATLTYDAWGKISNPVRIGYTFVSWALSDMSLTCTHYYGTSTSSYNTTTLSTLLIDDINVTQFLNLHSEDGATVTFKANWKPNQYKIVYVLGNDNGAKLGSGTFPSTATYDTAFNVSVPETPPYGYLFDGWAITGMSTDCTHFYSTNANGALSEMSGAGESFTVPKDSKRYMNLQSNEGATVTFTAVWKANVYNINYVLTDLKGGNGHFTSTQPVQASYDSYVNVPDPVRTGYSFIGWSLSGLADDCPHYYKDSSGTEIEFSSTNGGYFRPDNPNEYFVLQNVHEFKNLHSKNGAVVTLTANWSANYYDITYHYLPSNFSVGRLTPENLNYASNMTATKVQTVLYDSNFTTMKMAKSDNDSTGVPIPGDVKILYWIFYSSASSSYIVATLDSNGNPVPAHEYYLGVGTEQVYSSYTIWGEYDLFGDDVHAYAVYSFVDINIVIYYADSIVRYNNFATYKADPTKYGAKTLNDFVLPAKVQGRDVLGYWISSNLYVDGEITRNSITKYTLDGVVYTAYAGATIKWGYPTSLAQNPEDPTFYLYAVYDNSYDKLYQTEVVAGQNAISLATAGIFTAGQTYQITIRALEEGNIYDFSYVKLATSFIAEGAGNVGFDKIKPHVNSTTSNLPDFKAEAVTSTTLIITFTADANCMGYNFYIAFDRQVDLSSLSGFEIIINEKAPIR